MALLSWVRNIFRRSTLKDPAEWLYAALAGGSSTLSGMSVNERTALAFTAVWCAVRVLSEGVASLPFPVYRRIGRGRERARDNPVYGLLNSSANEECSAYAFRETLMGHVLLWGNAYAEIQWAGNGRPMALWPIEPDRVMPRRSDDGQLVYEVRNSAGGPVFIRPENMFHLHGLGYDGTVGYSPVHQARQAIGLGLAAEAFGAAFFGNAARPSGVLEAPAPLSETARKNLRESWRAAYSGAKNAGGVPILEEGIKWQSLTIPPDDAQFIATRQFQVPEIARVFRVPPHMLYDLERATFSNIEHQGIEFVTQSLRPWLVRWEQEVQRKLLVGETYAEHVVEGLLRGDIASRYNAYAIARQWGWMSVNEIRELENMNELPAKQGDIYLTPLNMGVAGEEPPPPPKPTLPAPADGSQDGEDDQDEDRSGPPATIPPATIPPATIPPATIPPAPEPATVTETPPSPPPVATIPPTTDEDVVTPAREVLRQTVQRMANRLVAAAARGQDVREHAAVVRDALLPPLGLYRWLGNGDFSAVATVDEFLKCFAADAAKLTPEQLAQGYRNAGADLVARLDGKD